MEDCTQPGDNTLNADSAISIDSNNSIVSVSSEDSDSTVIEAEPRSTARMAEMKTYQIHRFNGQNYQLWRRQMEIFMAKNKLKAYIIDPKQRTTANASTWDEKDAEAQAFIMRGLELSQLKYLTDCNTAAQMWSRLQSVHAEKSDQSVQILLEKFITCKMGPEENVIDHIATITSLAQRLKDIGVEQKESMVIAKILSGLTERFDDVRTAWYAVPSSAQSLEKLTEHLVNEEMLTNLRSAQNPQNNNSTKSAYMVKANKNGSGNKTNPKRKGKCNYCSKEGHWARECRKKQKDEKEQATKREGEKHSLVPRTERSGHTSAADGEDAHLFVLHKVETSENLNVFYADSGATDHMTFQRELLGNYIECGDANLHVKVGDGRRLPIVGKGEVKVQVSGEAEAEYTVKEVLMVPELDKNFISVSKATKVMDIHFPKGTGRVLFTKDGHTIVEGYEIDGLYKLNMKPKVAEHINLNVACAASIKVWHDRMGHVNFRKLVDMSKKNIVSDLSTSEIPQQMPFCKECTYSKQHRSSLPKAGANRAKHPGEI